MIPAVKSLRSVLATAAVSLLYIKPIFLIPQPFTNPDLVPESNMKSFIACLVLVSLSIASATKWSECGSVTGQVKSLQVSDCPDDADTCILKRGTSKSITIEFDSKNTSKSVKAVVHGVIAGVPLPFSLPKADGCAYGGLSCPLENGKTYTYTHSLDIKNSYPPLGVKVRWELKDDKKADIVCLEIQCEIQ